MLEHLCGFVALLGINNDHMLENVDTICTELLRFLSRGVKLASLDLFENFVSGLAVERKFTCKTLIHGDT